MSDTTRPQCAACIFWVPDDPVTTGHCHRYPPGVYFNAHSEIAAQKFPTVDQHHWCGEWSDRTEWLEQAAASSIRRVTATK